METAFAAEIASISLPYARAILRDGRDVRLSLPQTALPAGLAPGQRVYVEGDFSGDEVLVRRIALL